MHLLGAPPPEFVGFGLDGTLVDSVPDLAWCIGRTMPRFGIPLGGEALVRDRKPRTPAVDLLAHLQLPDAFAVVLGGDSLPRRKPDPLPLRHACSVLGAAVEQSIFVGDSAGDVAAARAAGMRVVCVSDGCNQGRDISEAAPDAVVDSLEELIGLCFGTSGMEGARAGYGRQAPGSVHGSGTNRPMT